MIAMAKPLETAYAKTQIRRKPMNYVPQKTPNEKKPPPPPSKWEKKKI